MLQAKKALGQHFLADRRYSRKIIEYAGVSSSDSVVEIGPGTGELTSILLETASRVVAIEFDGDMIEALRRRFPEFLPGRLTLLQDDVLHLDWRRVELPARFLLIGNLPYNIATRILKNSVELRERFNSFTFMVQKEVAERVQAAPGGKDYGYFTVLMEYHFERIRGFDVPPGAFRPRPKVISHVMMLRPRGRLLPVSDYALFERIVAHAFAHRRKTLLKNLVGAGFSVEQLREAFRVADIGEKARAEGVSLEQYACLARML